MEDTDTLKRRRIEGLVDEREIRAARWGLFGSRGDHGDVGMNGDISCCVKEEPQSLDSGDPNGFVAFPLGESISSRTSEPQWDQGEPVHNKPLTDSLAKWAVEFDIPEDALAELLNILRKADMDVPENPRTLLPTRTNEALSEGSDSCAGAEGTKQPKTNFVTIGETVANFLLTSLQGIQETLNTHTQMLHTLMERQGIAVDAGGTLPESLKFPIGSMEAFHSAELELQDADVFQNVVRVLRDIGGRTVDETIRRVLGYVLTNDMSLKFNLTGRNGKEPFGNSLFFGAVYQATKQNPQTSGCSRQDVEVSARKWFVGGRDRDGNRTLRAENDRARRALREMMSQTTE